MTHEEIRQIAENIRDCFDKTCSIGCAHCKAKHAGGFFICHGSQNLKIADAIEQLLAEVGK